MCAVYRASVQSVRGVDFPVRISRAPASHSGALPETPAVAVAAQRPAASQTHFAELRERQEANDKTRHHCRHYVLRLRFTLYGKLFYLRSR